MPLKLIENLQKLGFTGNEAKVYASLVCLKQAKASEIAENAGVPRPKIYGTLRGMEKKGYVRIIEGEPTFFCCVQPEVLILRIRADFMLSLSETASELESLTPGSNNFTSRNFNGEKIRV
ncbi:MAG: TrmB family transcriptional regulator [Methanosarcina sp.]|uniref:TrmB family transcriptional regulator n=1 Tax=Methanosarcina sp. TaxID=2213 RepID=UPI002625A082|nr:TrmB family transcriptional regulator [Methanosarcina sp.]MDD3247121.1 TrmB family transcriptional regulator [Methanosarcina sp.]MDD4249532.1 TrmB family transcriptional regulator [Methanosarcina sp.]